MATDHDNADTQMLWRLKYLRERHGSPDRTWTYDKGGYIQPGCTAVRNTSGRPQPVLTVDQSDASL